MADAAVQAELLPELLALTDEFEFEPYRNYRVFPRPARRAVLAAEVDATLRHPDGRVYTAPGGRGAAVARRLAWESGFFGLPMARIEYLLGSDAGARAHALVTYAARPGRDLPGQVRTRGTIRPFRPEDGPVLVAIARDAFRGFRGRFHTDPDLPRDRADAMYEEWARQCLNGEMADVVLVSEGAGQGLLGFLAFRRRDPVSTVTGIDVFGGGLGACRADTPGAYAGLIRAGTLWAHERGGVAECQTQNYNFATIRIYEAVGARYVRAEYTFHASPGAG